MATKVKKMDISRISDDELMQMFEDVFTPPAELNNMGEFELKCIREVGNTALTMEVVIVGMAGSPTIEDLKKNTIKDVRSIKMERADLGALTLKLKPKETLFLNSNDYVITYKS